MNPRLQTGIALITVLLILALATVAAVAMSSRQQLDIRRTTNILQIEQAYMALLGAEDFAKRLLIKDANKNKNKNKIDGLGDYWNNPLLHAAKQEVGGVTVAGFSIEDLQGRFNINNLVDKLRHNISQNNHRGFITLLNEYGLPPELADVAYDWIDNEPAQYQNGAEEDAYSGLEKPYRTPNLDMASASEMNRLMGVHLHAKEDGDESHKKRRQIIWNMLHEQDKNQKILIALPQGTKINVNTAASPVIYQMIVPGLDSDAAAQLHTSTMVAAEKAPPFEQLSDFWTDSRVEQLISKIPEADRVAIDVKSEYFLLRAEALNGDLVVYSNTILRRIDTGNGPAVHVVHRSYGKLGEI